MEVRKDADGVKRIFLNNKPLFQIGPLDQGWWPDGLYTAPTDEALRSDIDTLKKLGFNMCRKHVKVEPARWYYWCDKLGLMVWQDMPSAMPQRPRQRASSGAAPKTWSSRAGDDAQFRRELEAMIRNLRNAPSIVAWVPFNEGWGQHATNDILKLVKALDPSRLVDGPSGWEDRGYGDMKDMHNYPGPDMYPDDAGPRLRAGRVWRSRACRWKVTSGGTSGTGAIGRSTTAPNCRPAYDDLMEKLDRW